MLAPQATAKPGNMRPSILVLTGDADEFVPAVQVEDFRKEMREAMADFRVITYPGVKHSFTNPQAESHGMPQLGYSAEADRNSWKEMLTFFGRVLG
jgi:dienelactone hydrolase